jgi:hypothetical protein
VQNPNSTSTESLVGDLDCKVVSPPDGHPSANGALLVDGGKTLLINDVVEATTTVYDVDPETKMLTVRKKVVRRSPLTIPSLHTMRRACPLLCVC